MNAVSMTPEGRFVIAWEAYRSTIPLDDPVDIRSRVFDPSGSPLGPEQMISVRYDECEFPAVATEDDGHHVVAWSVPNEEGAPYGDVLARCFDEMQQLPGMLDALSAAD